MRKKSNHEWVRQNRYALAGLYGLLTVGLFGVSACNRAPFSPKTTASASSANVPVPLHLKRLWEHPKTEEDAKYDFSPAANRLISDMDFSSDGQKIVFVLQNNSPVGMEAELEDLEFSKKQSKELGKIRSKPRFFDPVVYMADVHKPAEEKSWTRIGFGWSPLFSPTGDIVYVSQEKEIIGHLDDHALQGNRVMQYHQGISTALVTPDKGYFARPFFLKDRLLFFHHTTSTMLTSPPKNEESQIELWEWAANKARRIHSFLNTRYEMDDLVLNTGQQVFVMQETEKDSMKMLDLARPEKTLYEWSHEDFADSFPHFRTGRFPALFCQNRLFVQKASSSPTPAKSEAEDAASERKNPTVWVHLDPATGNVIGEQEAVPCVPWLVISPDGKKVASYGNTQMAVWSFAHPETPQILQTRGLIKSLKWAKTSDRIAVFTTKEANSISRDCETTDTNGLAVYQVVE